MRHLTCEKCKYLIRNNLFLREFSMHDMRGQSSVVPNCNALWENSETSDIAYETKLCLLLPMVAEFGFIWFPDVVFAILFRFTSQTLYSLTQCPFYSLTNFTVCVITLEIEYQDTTESQLDNLSNNVCWTLYVTKKMLFSIKIPTDNHTLLDNIIRVYLVYYFSHHITWCLFTFKGSLNENFGKYFFQLAHNVCFHLKKYKLVSCLKL